MQHRGMISRAKSYLPYGVLLYVLLGGTGVASHYDIDQNAADDMIQNLQQQDPTKGINPNEFAGQIQKVFKVKVPSNISAHSIQELVNDVAVQTKNVIRGGENYGY